MSWQPQQQGLDEVLSMLRQTLSKENEVQKALAHVSIVMISPSEPCVYHWLTTSFLPSLPYCQLRLNTQRLEELRDVPDFLAYLSHILIFCTTEDYSHRAVAGILLKNSLNTRTGPPTGETDALALAYVKATILSGLHDKDQMVRQTVASVIDSLICLDEAGGWPEALDALTKGMQSQELDVVEVCNGLGNKRG